MSAPEVDLVLVSVIERLAPNPGAELLGTMLASVLAQGYPGLTVAVDWPAYLGKSRQEMAEAAAGYYRSRGEQLVREIALCPTPASRAILPLARQWVMDTAWADRLGSEWAAAALG